MNVFLGFADYFLLLTAYCRFDGAGNGTRTRDPNLGKVVLYQLSYSRNKKLKVNSYKWKVENQ